MEKLRVENFLVIRKAELDLKRFCVVIGPQASGKSILAKLVHLFREFFDESTQRILLGKNGEQESSPETTMSAVLKKSFSEYFPGFLSEEHQFLVEYNAAEFSVNVRGSRGSSADGRFEVTFSEEYLSFIERIKTQIADFKQSLQSEHPVPSQDIDLNVRELLDATPTAESFRQARKHSLFIPASRAFFVTLQKHVFSMLRAGVPLEPLMTNFGSMFEIAREYDERDDNEFLQKTEPWVHSILAGKYRFSEGEDWIHASDSRVKLRHASSGQQEALPMLLVLTALGSFMPKGSGFIIEEPEAHLYPQAQKDIVSLFGLISNARKLDFFITTHSPYILAALNNLILGGEVKEAVGNETLESVLAPETTLNYADVCAYTLTDGVLHPILDEEEKLIGINAIDSVSDEFSNEFEALLELREAGGRGAYTG